MWAKMPRRSTIFSGCLILSSVFGLVPALSEEPLCPQTYLEGVLEDNCSRTIGSVCSVTCHTGSNIDTDTTGSNTGPGVKKAVCSSDAQWHPSELCLDLSNDCQNLDVFNNGVYSESRNPKTLHYSCHSGYNLLGPNTQQCTINGTWEPPNSPICVKAAGIWCAKPFLINGIVKTSRDGSSPMGLIPGDKITMECNEQYAMMVDGAQARQLVLYCSRAGRWVTHEGWQVTPECSVKLCKSPPEVPNSRMGEYPSYLQQAKTFGGLLDGQEALYKCDPSYTLRTSSAFKLICQSGEWLGDLPSCVKSCAPPEKIANGVTYFTDQEIPGVEDFRQGFMVRYKCKTGYKLLGYSTLECEEGGQWSHHPPQCVLNEESGEYCKTIQQPSDGECVCETQSNLEYCEPFFVGMHVECTCHEGYRLVGAPILTCGQTGQWDYGMPLCLQDLVIDNSQKDFSTESQSHMSTLAIVVATACSVLGVLLLIMVIMVFRRRKPHPPRLCRPSHTPPPYSRVHSNSLDSHDRALLMGYENNDIALPSYEEATNTNQQQGGHFVSRSGGGQVGEYRPLPSIPSGMRSMQSLSGDSTNRHSIITSSTMNRDGISEVFGSIDTVNVSMSDASTAVTIETMDSASSHHSNISRRGTAGSINSSNNSLVTEDAPLLDNNERNEWAGEPDSGEEDVQNKPED